MREREWRGTFSRRGWLTMIIVAAGPGAALSTGLSWYLWGHLSRDVPTLLTEQNARIAEVQQHQDAQIRRINHLVGITRRELLLATRDVGTVRGRVGKLDGLMQTHLKWRHQTGARLDSIETSLKRAQQKLDKIDQKTPPVIVAPPPPKPWWRPW